MIYYDIRQTKDGLVLAESAYNRRFLSKTETVFSQCNGYLGVRAAFETKALGETRGAFVGGFFHRASKDEVTELVNCPDVTEFELSMDGEVLSLDLCSILEFQRMLCLKTGELKTEVLLETEQGRRVRLKCRRFASRENRHLLVQEITVKPDRAGVLTAVTGINGQMNNSGVSHFANVEARVFDKKYLYTKNVCDDGQTLHVLCAAAADRNPQKADFVLKRRSVYETKQYSLKADETLHLTKCSYYADEEIQTKAVKETLKEGLDRGYDALYAVHKSVWDQLWHYAAIEIEGADLEEKACLMFAVYHLLGMTPFHTDTYSVAAKGLTGEGYKGHVFWDTEVFVLPFFTAVFPEVSKNLLGYRYRGLPGARKKAEENGYRGAMYPWETACTGEEETPEYAALNIHTGRANRVWSKVKEHHVTADIIYALSDYLNVTGDRAFLEEKGYEMLIETAGFWVSRSVFSKEKDRYEIRDVIGPDEYTEHVDNNAYTNYMAWFNVKLAKEEMERLKEQDASFYQKLSDAYSLEEQLLQWEDFLKRLYLPRENEQGIIPQDDTFLCKPQLPGITEYKNSDVKQAVLLDYSREEVVNMQVLKQADTVMLLNMLPSLFSPETILKNVLFYEARTIHDSSLSYCAHAIACAKTGNLEHAYRFFEKAMEIDLNTNALDSADGIHSGSLGGVWNCVILGFAGVEHKKNAVIFRPNLPKKWSSLAFYHKAGGTYYKIRIDKKGVQAKKEGQERYEPLPTEDGKNYILNF